MSENTVTVDVRGRDVNLAALLTQLEARMRQADASGVRLSQTTGGTLVSSQQRAANSALSLAQAQARLAVAEGDAGRAAGILNTALAANAGASEKAIVGVQTQIAKLQSGKSIFQEFGSAASSSLLGIVGPAALAGGAIAGVTGIIHSFEESLRFRATLDQSTAAITAQLSGVRDSAQAFASASAFATRYKVTQEELIPAMQAAVGIMRQSKSSTEDVLAVLLRLQQLSPEQGLEGAALALKELQAQSTVSLVGRFEVSRDAANKMKTEIEGGADAVKVMSKYLDSAGIGMEALEARTKGAAGALNDVKLAQEQVKLAQAEIASSPGGLAIVEKQAQAYRELGQILSGNITQAKLLGGVLETAANPTAIGNLIAKEYEDAAAKQRQAGAAIALGGAMDEERIKVGNAQIAMENLTARLGDTRRESILLSQASQESAIASQTNATQKELEGLQTQLLAQQNLAAANAFLSLNPNINAAGIQAAVTAGAITPLIGRLAELIGQVNAAKAALAGFTSGRPETGGDVIARTMGAAALNQGFFAVQTERATAAQNAQTLATGSTAAKVKLLTAEYERQRRIFGANSAEAINAQTKLIQAQDKAGKAAKAGGGVRLSDQQKLNNSLLATDERYQNQAEDAEAAHQQRLIDIDKQAQERMKAAQAAFDQDRLDSRAGFYEGLAGIEDQGLRKAMSAKFEAAVLESNEIAKTKGADAAQHFLDEARKAIEAEARLQGEIDKAKKDGKTGEAEYLEGVKKLQEAADKARLDNIRNQGSDIVTERDKQLADEQAKYEQQTGKILTASERATAAKIANAQRSGKAIQDENLTLERQAQLLDRIGARAGTPSSAAQAPAGTTAPAGTPAGAPAGVLDLGAVVSAINALQPALDAVKGAIERDTSQTTGAIRSLGPRLVGN